MDKTLTELITRTQQELYQQAGLSVQVYSQTNLANKLQDAFDFIFSGGGEGIEWKRFEVFEVYALDGTTGRAITDVSAVFASWDDVYRVYGDAARNVPLEKFSRERNPADYTGGTPQAYMYDATNVLRIAPFTATGNITVIGRTRQQDAFALDEKVPFDHLALIYHACWSYATDDASNPAMAEKFFNLYKARIDDLVTAQNKEPINLTSGYGGIPDRWYDK